MNKLEIVKELLKFLMMNKKYWLIPIIILLVLLGLLILVAESSVLSPFVYSLF